MNVTLTPTTMARQLLLMVDPDQAADAGLDLNTSDRGALGVEIIARYAGRWGRVVAPDESLEWPLDRFADDVLAPLAAQLNQEALPGYSASVRWAREGEAA